MLLRHGLSGKGKDTSFSCPSSGTAALVHRFHSSGAPLSSSRAAKAIADSGASRASLIYPFPIAGNTAKDVAPIDATLQALEGAVSELERAGLDITIKGLPGCYLGRMAGYMHRSANRWYVDADHQLDGAVLFFPRVVSFTKQESCRFCKVNDRCDGFFATYLKRPGFPALEPIQE